MGLWAVYEASRRKCLLLLQIWLVTPTARAEVERVVVEHLLAGRDGPARPELHLAGQVHLVLHGCLAAMVHGRAWVEKEDAARVGLVRDAVVHLCNVKFTGLAQTLSRL